MLIELIMAILLSTTSEEDTAVAKASADGGAIMTNWASGNMSVRHKLAASAVITLLNLSVDARTVQQVGDEESCRGEGCFARRMCYSYSVTYRQKGEGRGSLVVFCYISQVARASF